MRDRAVRWIVASIAFVAIYHLMGLFAGVKSGNRNMKDHAVAVSASMRATAKHYRAQLMRQKEESKFLEESVALEGHQD